MLRATTVGLLMRHCANVVVAAVGVLDPSSGASSSGRWLLAVFGLWSLYRIVTRSGHGVTLATDYLMVLAVCLAVPMLVAGADFGTHNTTAVAIAGTSVIGFTVALPVRATIVMTTGVAAAFAIGSAHVAGWEHLRDMFNLYYFTVQWSTVALIRLLLLRVAAAVDRARADRQSVELRQQVSTAVREYEREQLALLHDTAASTLLMVGQGASLPSERLAAQARRDLELLHEGPWVAPVPDVELLSALRQCAEHLSTAVEFGGLSEIWLDGGVANAVVAASREAMNNVDRHAGASRLTITVCPETVSLTDDGVGFDPDVSTGGHGIAESIVGRMRRAGGDADVRSAPGAGTRTVLSWGAAPEPTDSAPPRPDPEHMIQRSRVRYGLALTAYAAANLILMAPYAVMHGDHPAAQVGLAGVGLISTATAVPGIRHGRWRARPLAIAGLLLITVVQPLLLPLNEVGSQHYWAQGAVGWCLLPLMIGVSVPRGAGLLVLAWLLGSAVELIREPSVAHWVNVGLGTASILGVQLFALAFSGLMRDAAANAHVETEARQRLLRRERVGEALRAEYHDRYAALMGDVLPLLEELSDIGSVDGDVQRRARAQSRQLRILFDQAGAFDHPLMQQLRPLTDRATARGVEIAVDRVGELPDLSDIEIGGLLAPLSDVFDAATSAARVVLCATPDEVTASIVCDHIVDVDLLADRLTHRAEQTDLVVNNGTVWLLVAHQLSGSAATASC